MLAACSLECFITPWAYIGLKGMLMLGFLFSLDSNFSQHRHNDHLVSIFFTHAGCGMFLNAVKAFQLEDHIFGNTFCYSFELISSHFRIFLDNFSCIHGVISDHSFCLKKKLIWVDFEKHLVADVGNRNDVLSRKRKRGSPSVLIKSYGKSSR